jgi:hypothetical protein
MRNHYRGAALLQTTQSLRRRPPHRLDLLGARQDRATLPVGVAGRHTAIHQIERDRPQHRGGDIEPLVGGRHAEQQEREQPRGGFDGMERAGVHRARISNSVIPFRSAIQKP